MAREKKSVSSEGVLPDRNAQHIESPGYEPDYNAMHYADGRKRAAAERAEAIKARGKRAPSRERER